MEHLLNLAIDCSDVWNVWYSSAHCTMESRRGLRTFSSVEVGGVARRIRVGSGLGYLQSDNLDFRNGRISARCRSVPKLRALTSHESEVSCL